MRWKALAPSIAMIVSLMVLVGCASAPPYQPMSDARQAIDAAEDVVNDEPRGQELLDQSRRAMQQAERHLKQGDYPTAREHALEARSLAIEAREHSAATRNPGPR